MVLSFSAPEGLFETRFAWRLLDEKLRDTCTGARVAMGPSLSAASPLASGYG